MRIPDFFKFILKYLSPLFLVTIFVLFILQKMVGWNFEFGERPPLPRPAYVLDLLPGAVPSPGPASLSSC